MHIPVVSESLIQWLEILQLVINSQYLLCLVQNTSEHISALHRASDSLSVMPEASKYCRVIFEEMSHSKRDQDIGEAHDAVNEHYKKLCFARASASFCCCLGFVGRTWRRETRQQRDFADCSSN